MTAYKCAGGPKKLDLRSGSQRHKHFLGFFNMPVQTPTQGQPFYTVIPRNRPIWSPYTTRLGYGGHIIDFIPGGTWIVSGLKRTLDLRLGFQRHRHFEGDFHVPVQCPPYPQRDRKRRLNHRYPWINKF